MTQCELQCPACRQVHFLVWQDGKWNLDPEFHDGGGNYEGNCIKCGLASTPAAEMKNRWGPGTIGAIARRLKVLAGKIDDDEIRIDLLALMHELERSELAATQIHYGPLVGSKVKGFLLSAIRAQKSDEQERLRLAIARMPAEELHQPCPATGRTWEEEHNEAVEKEELYGKAMIAVERFSTISDMVERTMSEHRAQGTET